LTKEVHQWQTCKTNAGITHSMSNLEILDELKSVIDARGTRSAFAEQVGIGEPYLSLILSGHKPISRLPGETLRRLKDASGISVDRLLEERPRKIKATGR
jgi:hypothetical protein